MNTNTELIIPQIDYSQTDLQIRNIIEKVVTYMPKVNRQIIEAEIMRAYKYSKDAHDGQLRKSGEHYISHPVGAAQIILSLKPDLTTIQACLLHDVAEDTSFTIDDIRTVFGDDVALICEGLCKVSKLKYRGEERTIESLRKMFIAMSEDLRVIIVKLADRIHNMRTLDFHAKREKRDRIALETLNIYAPIADRLGIFEFKEILENECFRALYPEDYKFINRELAELGTQQEHFYENAKKIVADIIPEHIFVSSISFRVKSAYSIFKKMHRKGGYEHVRDLHDLFAMRIITDSIPHCYEILGEIHTHWAPVPKKFKDYVALPKENGYQSLHTTVVGMFQEFRRQPTEIQIRTQQMHEQAEIGIAAHFEYSETGKPKIAKDVYWVAELHDIIKSSQGDEELLSKVKIDIFDDRIFAFTPKGDIIGLPKGSTPIDFAYSIHSDLGHHLVVARANGKVVPLDYQIINGDSIEIVTESTKHPSITWLSFVKTAKAKDAIKAYVHRMNRDDFLEKGKFILNAYIEKHLGKSLDKELSILRVVDGSVLDTKQKEDILAQIGNLSRKPSSVLRTIIGIPRERKKPKEAPDNVAISESVELLDSKNIIIGGQKGIAHNIAQCCHPKVGEKIVAYATRTIINIHKITCPFLKKSNIERCIPANWEGMESKGMVLRLEIEVENKIGVLKELTDIIYRMRLSIEELSTHKTKDGYIQNVLTLESAEEDYFLYERLIDKLKFSMEEFISARLVDMR